MFDTISNAHCYVVTSLEISGVLYYYFELSIFILKNAVGVFVLYLKILINQFLMTEELTDQQQYHRSYYQEHRDAMIERQLAYHRENREKNLARMRIYNREYWRKKKMNLIEKMTPNTCKEPKKKREKKEPKEKKPLTRVAQSEEATESPHVDPLIQLVQNAKQHTFVEPKKTVQKIVPKPVVKPVYHKLMGAFVLSFD